MTSLPIVGDLIVLADPRYRGFMYPSRTNGVPIATMSPTDLMIVITVDFDSNMFCLGSKQIPVGRFVAG